MLDWILEQMNFSQCLPQFKRINVNEGILRFLWLIWLIVSNDASCEGYLDTVMIINAKLLVLSPGRAVRPRVTKLARKNCQVRGWGQAASSSSSASSLLSPLLVLINSALTLRPQSTSLKRTIVEFNCNSSTRKTEKFSSTNKRYGNLRMIFRFCSMIKAFRKS